MRGTGRWTLLVLALAALWLAGCNDSPTGVQSSGTLVISVQPEGASPRWRLVGRGRIETGTGAHRFTDLLPGLYTLTWLPTDGWVNVGTGEASVNVVAGESVTIEGTFVADQPVHVTVQVLPAGLDAHWALTRPDGTVLYGSGNAVVDLEHSGWVTLEWTPVDGYWLPQPPRHRMLAVNGDATFTGEYQEILPRHGDFVCLPTGSFVMGSPADELGHHDDEVQHEVTLTHRLWISRQEVTQEQFMDAALAAAARGDADVLVDAVVKLLPGHAVGEVDTIRLDEFPGLTIYLTYEALDTDRSDPQVRGVTIVDHLDGTDAELWTYEPSVIFIDRLYQPGDPLFIYDNELPQQVNWPTAATYCDWLSQEEGLPRAYDHTAWTLVAGPYDVAGYRLPTEAEWEFAARAGTTTAFYTGPITSQTVNDANLGLAAWYGSQATLRPPMRKEANAFGLYDMLGNLWEWTGDWYGPYPAEAVTDPAGPAEGTLKVTRGGYYASMAVDCRAANRRPFTPLLEDGIGIRPVRVHAATR